MFAGRDTIVLEVLSASPFRFQVECIAESDTPTNIHVWNFPKSYNGWHRFDNNKTERLSVKKENLVSTLTGTYQQTLCFDGEEYIWAMMKLVPDGTFEYISNIFNLDGEGGNYLTGTWNVNKDTLVCNVVSDLFPPRVQSRYDGQLSALPIRHGRITEKKPWNMILFTNISYVKPD